MGAKPSKPEAVAKPIATGEASAEKRIAEEHAGEPAGAARAVFSLEEALASVAGEADLLRQMASYFLDEAPQQLAKMQAGLERNDGAAIARAAHRLRGTVIYLGAEGLLQNLEQLEDASGVADLRLAAGLIAELAGKNSALAQALASYLADEGDGQPA